MKKLAFCLLLFANFSFAERILTVTKIESCAASMRCRVIFDDGTTDLIFNPFIGMKVKKI